MKKSIKLVLLLAVLAVVSAGAFLITRIEEKKEAIKNTDEIFVSIPYESVSALNWEYEDTSLSFTKDGKWKWSEDENFPVSEDKIKELLGVFENFGASFIIENVDDFSQYGLDNPTCTINIKADTDLCIKLGNYSTIDSKRYVSIGNGNVYLVSTDPFEKYNITLDDTINNDKALSNDDVTRIETSGMYNFTLYYDENTSSLCEDDVYFTDINGNAMPLDTTKVTSYINTIRAFTPNEYLSYYVTDDELKEFGLDNPELSISIYQKSTDESGNEEESKYFIEVSRSAAVKEAEAAGEEETQDSYEFTYIRINSSQIVYKFPYYRYSNIKQGNYNYLRHSELYTGSTDKLISVDVSLDGETYSFTKGNVAAEGEEENIGWIYNDKEVYFTTAQTAISELTVSSFNIEDLENSGKEEITITLGIDDENYPSQTITLYRYDGDSCYAYINGQAYCLATRDSTVNLIEAINKLVL